MIRVQKCTLLLFACLGCYAETVQPPVSTDELQFFRYMLMSVGGIDHHPDAAKRYENYLVKEFGLNAQESTLIHDAAQRLNTLLTQLRQATQATLNGKTAVTAQDTASLKAMAIQRDQLITTLSNEILKAVRPEVADRLRTPGRTLANTAKPTIK